MCQSSACHVLQQPSRLLGIASNVNALMHVTTPPADFEASSKSKSEMYRDTFTLTTLACMTTAVCWTHSWSILHSYIIHESWATIKLFTIQAAIKQANIKSNSKVVSLVRRASIDFAWRLLHKWSVVCCHYKLLITGCLSLAGSCIRLCLKFPEWLWCSYIDINEINDVLRSVNTVNVECSLNGKIKFNEFSFVIILISISQKARECIHENRLVCDGKLYNWIKRRRGLLWILYNSTASAFIIWRILISRSPPACMSAFMTH